MIRVRERLFAASKFMGNSDVRLDFIWLRPDGVAFEL